MKESLQEKRELCKRMEEWVIDSYPKWKNAKTEAEKRSYYKFGIPDGIFRVSLLKRQFSYKISERLLEELFVNPKTTMSKDHDTKRTFSAKKFFENFDEYNFTGDGSKMMKIIFKQTFSYVTREENHSKYDGTKINRIRVSERVISGIKKYNRLAKKHDWFQNKKITKLEDFKKIPRTRKIKSEEQFFRWVD